MYCWRQGQICGAHHVSRGIQRSEGDHRWLCRRIRIGNPCEAVCEGNEFARGKRPTHAGFCRGYAVLVRPEQDTRLDWTATPRLCPPGCNRSPCIGVAFLMKSSTGGDRIRAAGRCYAGKWHRQWHA